eukprot:4872044-Pyramimonas_sp.AAC.1
MRTVSGSLIGVAPPREYGEILCDGIGGIGDGARAGEARRVWIEAAAGAAPGDVRRACPARMFPS